MTQTAEAKNGTSAAPANRQGIAARLGALACLACCVCAVLAALFKEAGFEGPAVFFLILYILTQPHAVLRSQWLMAAALTAVGLALAALRGSVPDALWQGGRGTLMFILLFASVTLLQYPALHSPSMQVVRVMVTNLPPGKRYLWLSLASHFLAAITNFAGFALLASFVSASAAGDLRKRMALALSRGFVAASTWSPFFLAMAVVVSLMPRLRWLDVAAPGIFLGLCLIAFGSFYDRLTRRDARPAATAPAAPIAGRNASLLRLGLLSAILVGGVAALDAIAHLSMSATIAIVVTVFSLSWFAILAAGRSAELPVSIREYAADLVVNVSGLRGLSVLFIAANVLGQGVAAAIDGQMLVSAAAGIGISGIWWIPFLICVIAGSSFCGLHSVIMIVVIGHTLPAETIGLSQPTLALVMLTSWGIGGVISPLSNLTLYAANMLGQSNWSMAWRDNGVYSLGCIAISALVIMGFHLLQGGGA
ncbi:MAG: hypothetical protein AB7R90_03130 [Reyranellaceae bacterium]